MSFRRAAVSAGPLTGVRVVPAASPPRGHVVCVPGMYHDAWYFGGLQAQLAERGYESVALTLKPYSFLRPSTAKPCSAWLARPGSVLRNEAKCCPSGAPALSSV